MKVWQALGIAVAISLAFPVIMTIISGNPVFLISILDEPEDPFILMLWIIILFSILVNIDGEKDKESTHSEDNDMTEDEMTYENMMEGEYDDILDEIKTKKRRSKKRT